MQEARENIDDVLREVMCFKIISIVSTPTSYQSDGDDGPPQFLTPSQPLASTSIGGLVQQQQHALSQVENLLNRVDQIENLFPTLKALGEAHHLYCDEKFRLRLNHLILWRNITRDIENQLKSLAKILYIYGSSDDWPWFDTSENKRSNSEVFEDGDSSVLLNISPGKYDLFPSDTGIFTRCKDTYNDTINPLHTTNYDDKDCSAIYD